MKYLTWQTFAILAVLLVGGSLVYSNYTSNKANEGIVLEDHIKGNSEADVVLTEYSDFQCPACGQFYPVVKDIVEEFSDELRFEYKHFPLPMHPFAVSAAKAAEAAGQQGKFFEMHDKLFENQTTWSNASNPQVYFEKYADELNLDVDLFKKHMYASAIADSISDSFDEARALGFTGTPSFLLNGEKMEFATFEEFRTQIEAALGTDSVENSAQEDASTESTAVGEELILEAQ